MTYTSNLTPDNGWTQGDGTAIPADVWYRTVLKTDGTKSWHLLSGDTVTVNAESVTKDTMADAAKAELVYTAYAAQLHKNGTQDFTAAEAWEVLNPTTP